MLTLGLDPRQLQLFSKDLGKLIEREIDLHDVLPGLGAALGTFALALADDIAFFAVAGADALRVISVSEVRQLDATHRDRNEMLAFLADQLALGEEFAQVLPDPALDDLAEALVIFFDLQDQLTAPSCR